MFNDLVVWMVAETDTPMLNAIEINILKGLKRNGIDESKCEKKERKRESVRGRRKQKPKTQW